MKKIRKIFFLFLATVVLISLTACSNEKSKTDKDEQYRRLVFSLIAKQVNSRDFEILEIIPLHTGSNLIAISINTAEDTSYKRLYKADTNLIETKLTGEYLWQSESLMGISVNTEIIANNTVVYGDINNDHLSSQEKMLVPIDLKSLEILFVGSPNFMKAKLYDGFYIAVLKNKSSELQEVFFVNKTENPEVDITFTYGEEYEYIKSLEPDLETPTEPDYMKYPEKSNEWYIAKYISPLVFTGILIDKNWTNPEVIEPSHFTSLFFALRKVNPSLDYSRFYDETSEKYTVPANFLEDIIAEYFDVKPSHLRKSQDYDKSGDSYILNDYNVSGEFFMSLEEIVNHDDNTITMYVNAYNKPPLTKENLSVMYSFTIEINPESNKYKYLSYTYEKPFDEITFEDLNNVE